MVCIIGVVTLAGILLSLISMLMFPKTWESIDEKLSDKIRGEKI